MTKLGHDACPSCHFAGLHAGFTVFLERKIIGRLHGEKALQFHAANGYLDLVDSIHEIGETHNFTALVPDLSGGVDPDDSFSKVPYEKGFYFLYYLQVVFCSPTLFTSCPGKITIVRHITLFFELVLYCQWQLPAMQHASSCASSSG